MGWPAKLATVLVSMAVVSACAGRSGRSASTPLAEPRRGCAANQRWNGSACAQRGDAGEHLRKGTAALADFRVDEALPLLDRARAAGFHVHAEHVQIYEQLGIAYSYLEREQEASAAFEMLLSLDPGHLLSYTLSPKATFLFERVRRKAASRAPPSLQVTWPHGLSVSRPVPIDVEVISDPRSFLKRATLHVRRRGATEYEHLDLRLSPPGTYRRLLLPAPSATRPEVLQIYLTALDETGNEVLVWSNSERPREIALAYQRPTPWYRKWWIWAITGGVVAIGTGTAVYIAGRDLPDTVGGVVEVSP